MEKVKKKKSLTESRSFKTEIMMFVIFMSVGVATVLFKVDGWLSLAMLGIGLLSLYFNNVNKILDFIMALAWSAAYLYFGIINGLYAQAFLVSAFYLFVNLFNLVAPQSNTTIVEEHNKLKPYQIWALIIVCVFGAVGTFFLVRIKGNKTFAIFDTLAAVMLCASLYMMLKRCIEYFVVRLIAMIATIALWVAMGLVSHFNLGCINIAVMFIAFILYDNVRMRKWSLQAKHVAQRQNADIFSSTEYREAERKYQREHKRGLPNRSVGIDKNDERN